MRAPSNVKHGRETVDAFAREVIQLIGRLRGALEGSPQAWPDGRGRQAATISRDLATAVAALDAAVEELYFQAESLEAAHQALEIERRILPGAVRGRTGRLSGDRSRGCDPSSQPPSRRAVRLRRGGPRGGAAAGTASHRAPSLAARPRWPTSRCAIRRPNGSGEAVSAAGHPFSLALTAAVVRHADDSVYRVRWSLRDISRRPRPD